MHPIAFFVGEYPVRYAGLLYVVAVIVVWRFAYGVARRKGWDTDVVLPGVSIVVTVAYLGARFAGALRSWTPTDDQSLGNLLRQGELSFFGGLALGSIALVAFIRRVRLPLGEAADALAPMAPVTYALFRLGCLLNGDDYGRPTTMPWGVAFPEGSPRTSEHVHPVQLYEIVLMIPVLLALRWRSRHGLRDGALAFELCVLMGVERFVVDFWRTGDPGHLATTQWLALAFAAIGVAGTFWLRRVRSSAIP